MRRSRLHYAMLTAIVIVAGCIASSDLSESWPSFLAMYSGDTLWALMIFLGFGFLFPSAGITTATALTLLLAFGIEFSQLYHAPWLDSFRDTFVGAVTIGSHFTWSALGCYVAGCCIGAFAEVAGRSLQFDHSAGSSQDKLCRTQ